jgi:hypothetical protein
VTDQIPAEATPDWYAAELAAGDGVCRHPTCDCKAAVAYRAGRAAERERIRQLAEREHARIPCHDPETGAHVTYVPFNTVLDELDAP